MNWEKSYFENFAKIPKHPWAQAVPFCAVFYQPGSAAVQFFHENREPLARDRPGGQKSCIGTPRPISPASSTRMIG